MQFIHLFISFVIFITMMVSNYMYSTTLTKSKKILWSNAAAWGGSFLILLILSNIPKMSNIPHGPYDLFRGLLITTHTILSIMMLTWNSIFFDKHKEDIPEHDKVLLILNISLWSISSALMVTHFMSFTWIKKKTKRLPLHKGRASKL